MLYETNDLLNFFDILFNIITPDMMNPPETLSKRFSYMIIKN